VALRAPHVHDASTATLSDVVRHYEKAESRARVVLPCCFRSSWPTRSGSISSPCRLPA